MGLLTITAATVFSMYLNLNATSADGYYYNTNIENGKVYSATVMSNEGDYLTAKLKYDYTYDAQDRLTCKEVKEWNANKAKWDNLYCMVYTYGDDYYTLERVRWNKHDNAYNKHVEKAVYHQFIDSVISVEQYKWNDNNRDFVMTGKVLVMHPQNDLVKR